MTPKQRKIAWISAAALVIVYYAPAVVNMAMQSAYQRQAAQAKPAGGLPMKPQAPPAAPGAPALLHYLLGEYTGRAVVAKRGICALKFELRDNREKPGTFSGYSTLVCTPLWTVQRWRPAIAVNPNPTSAILSGTPEDQAIRFTVNDTVSGACPPSAFTVKPFGATQIAVGWKDACGGGQLVLARSGR